MNRKNPADEVVSTLRKIIRAIDLHSKQLTKKYGLTGPQIIVLKEIRESPDRPISEIARKVSLSQATVTSILDRLEQQGYAQRHRSMQDKRKVHLVLTEKAEAVLGNNPSLLQDEFYTRFNDLESWEQNMILSSLQRLALSMNAEDIKTHSLLVSDSEVNAESYSEEIS
jgi:DNA-binding MarR family transcriptional regulator